VAHHRGSLLIVLGCVLAPLAGVAVWARNRSSSARSFSVNPGSSCIGVTVHPS
jgi:hypothetical protein